MKNPAHPGTIRKLALGEMGVSEAATRLKVSRPTLSKILNGNAGISADMALRLEAFLAIPANSAQTCKNNSNSLRHDARNGPEFSP